MDACTIVARRELARARVLVNSLRAHDPGARVVVLVLDGVDGADALDGAHTLTLAQLLGKQAGMMLACNPSAAIEAAALPALLTRLLAEGSRPVLYLGSGLRVLGPLLELREILSDRQIVLVSRMHAEPEGVERGPEPFHRRAGGGAISHRTLACNPGADTDRLLRAWPRCFADADAVYDWFDGIPALASDVAVLQDAGYGLDPWTMSAARTDDRSDSLHVEGRPARTFDFSGLDPSAPERNGDAAPEARLASIAALVALRRQHAQDLDAAGWTQDRERPSRFERLRDGTRITGEMRRLLIDGVAEGRLTESPFTQCGHDALYAYLSEPAAHGAAAGLSRLHLEIWRIRPDVQAAYPQLDGPDGECFAEWLREHAAEDHGIPDALLPPRPHTGARSNGSASATEAPPWGVNVAGFFDSERGLGEAARLLIAGLDASGVPALPVQARLLPPTQTGLRFASLSTRDAPYPINIVCINGDLVDPFAREAGETFFAGRHTIALWWWETPEIPESWMRAFAHVDEVWVGSQHIYDAVAPVSPVPVVKIALPVTMPRVPRRERAELGLPEEGFLFLYVHDYRSTAARKNPLGAIEAFKRAFPAGSGAKLVVKSIYAESVPHEHDRVLLAAAEHPDISLIDGFLSAGEKNAMIAACDCYVSLHRSEGLGLTIAEAMLLGKPVIATRYGGNLEFMSDDCSYLVDWKPIAVGEDAYPYAAGSVWADPDLELAAAAMREVFEHPERARARGELGRRAVAAGHSPETAGAQMRDRLQTIHERLPARPPRKRPVAERPPPAYPELGELIAYGPPVHGTGLPATAKRFIRRGTRLLMRPFAARQQAVNSRLHSSIADLEERVWTLSEELNDRAEQLNRMIDDRFAEGLGTTLASARRDDREIESLQTAVDALERGADAPSH